MGRKKKLPHGMTENMVRIMELSIAARESGVKSYGRGVAGLPKEEPKPKSEPLPPERKKKKPIPPNFCIDCGADISHYTRNKKRCDECASKREKERHAFLDAERKKHGSYIKPAYEVKCCVCGKTIIRHTKSRVCKCDDCKKYPPKKR